jgi:prepilin-type N-terminal cleavage/methylation domain-containing protein
MATTKKYGFTIVEILVTTIIISILAAVSVLAFNGAQNRAYMAQVYANVSNAAKLMNVYHTINGTYPIVADTNCLGKVSDYPAANGFASGSCGIDTSNSSSWGQANDSFNTMLSSQGTIPSGVTKIAINAGIKYRGIYFQINDYAPGSPWPDSVFFEFAVPGNQQCLGTVNIRRYDSSASSTYCSYYFNASGS